MSVIPQQQLLGEGSFGSVFKVHDHKTKPFVIKVIKKNSKQRVDDMRREMQVGKKLNHKSIVKVLQTDEDADNWFISMEFIEGENLLQYIERTMDATSDGLLRLPQPLIKNIFKKMVKGLCHAHKQGVAHLDLKLENTMITKKNDIKIIDFGLCSDKDVTGLHTRFVGSPEYCAPEIIQRKAYRPDKADVWSLGTLLYILLTGEMPFTRETRQQVEQGDRHPNVEWTNADHVPKKAKDLVEKMLTVIPESRITMEQVRKHSWLRWTL